MPLALYQAVHYFDASKGVKFTTISDYFVKKWCRNATQAWKDTPPLVSLNERIDPSGEDSREYGETIADEDSARRFEMVELADLRKDVATALSDLREDRAEILRLIYLEGLSTEEAAKRMGITERKAHGLRTRALQDLRRPCFGYLRQYYE